MSTYRVTAHVGSAVVGLVESPLYLDALLAWAMAQERGLIALHASETPADLSLPLGRMHMPGMPLEAWSWASSPAHYEVQKWTSLEVRRKPHAIAMAKYTKDKNMHLALGPHKARDTTMQACLVRAVHWDVETNDIDEVLRLARTVTNLGRFHSHGYGKVTRWEAEETSTSVQREPIYEGQTVSVRPPYWHPSTRYTVGEHAC